MPIKSCRKCGGPIPYKKSATGAAGTFVCETCQRGARITEEILRDKDEDREDEP